ncbi:outer membrane protein assembly factor BamA [Thermaurantimonas aggregans]|uniref:Outer membrane protein assembly factor BamA n=1 Tax=Thermaurantimonas aggregans TaxID=2173829 RepID=A0A401XIF9_9FLAO|nr:outer membrane protein assembly factor BamA [Thermaurantimonas aggregans]MCX8148742.1 outer membrane protein assembly factor BamA [Thermaurantimonas aggregans]GCD76799.1 outer membrane protein assembly factor BamA [Thermaurantimonas aggregans]
MKILKIPALYTVLLLSLYIVLPSQIHGQVQNTVEVTEGLEYEIGGITLAGAQHLDYNLVLLISGLNVGDRIVFPSDKITRAIKNLWKQKLFEDIQIYVTGKSGRIIYLEIYLKDLPRLSKYYITGVKKSRRDELRDEIKLNRGNIVTDNLIITAKNKILKYYEDKGYFDAEVEVVTERDTAENNALILGFRIKEGERIKIKEIEFIGNKNISDAKLRKAMKETKRHRWYNIFRTSKYIDEKFREDLEKVIDKYQENGYRDARILKDSIYRIPGDNFINLYITIEEGNKFYFRNITWIGNTKYPDEVLNAVLKIKKGDPYDAKRLSERLYADPNGNDVNSLYMDNGYLFFNLTPVEVLIENDSIDLEMRIREGRQATINRVTVNGNDRTNDHVIMREVRTRPGDLFRKSDIQRTMRELSQLGFFDPQQLNVNPVPNPETGTVDIEYTVVERSTSQLELQGGWGGGLGIVGTLGLSFNNFSARNIFNKKAWAPLPSGDGQTLNLRAQSTGRFFQNYSISFTEPWLGGKKPNSLTISGYHSVQNFGGRRIGDPLRQALNITGLTVGLGKRLRWPDDYFTLYQALEFQHYRLDNFELGIPNFRNGFSNNFSYRFVLTRNNTDVPIFPTRGSNTIFTLKLTPPYSLLTGRDYSDATPQDKYYLLEYYKFKFNTTWYTEIYKNIVISSHAEMGFMGTYNRVIGLSPFERFFVGGDGIQNFILDGREIIGLRGYPNNSIVPGATSTGQQSQLGNGGVLYSKYTAELRFLISPNPNAQIWPLLFVEAGNNFGSFREYRPFQLYRSTGAGIRIFMPMFGLLGIDVGYGFDPVPGFSAPSGWRTHFIIGQQF